MDKYGYKEGTDNEFAPWNQEPSGQAMPVLGVDEKARLKAIHDEAIARIESVFGKGR